MSFLKTLNMQCDRYTRLHRDLHQADKTHWELLKVCRTWDPESAAETVCKHIMEAGLTLDN
jgi:DNA-binding FadR family transcriptional regulator